MSAQDYFVKINWLEDRTGVVHADGKPCLKVEPPFQFGGGKENWSPEELLLAAVSSCLMSTFMTFARKENLKVLSYDGVVYGNLQKTPRGFEWAAMTNEIKLDVDPKDEERAKVLLLKAKQNCIIANSVKVEVALKLTVNGENREFSFIPRPTEEKTGQSA